MGALAWLLAVRTAVWLRWILILSCPLILVGVVLCGFRAAILAVAVGVAVVGVCQKRVLQGLLLITGVAVGVLYRRLRRRGWI